MEGTLINEIIMAFAVGYLGAGVFLWFTLHLTYIKNFGEDKEVNSIGAFVVIVLLWPTLIKVD